MVDSKSTENQSAPKSIWERILNATPVLMTILSTILAGLSSSEMTQSQYHRSLASQYQSKAGDQWAFFQAKRIRGIGLENTAELLQSQLALGDPAELERDVRIVSRHLEAAAKPGNATPAYVEKIQPVALSQALLLPKSVAAIHQTLEKPDIHKIFDAVKRGRLPAEEDRPLGEGDVKKALEGLEELKRDADIDELVASIPRERIYQALDQCQQNVREASQALEPMARAGSEVDKAFADFVALNLPALGAMEKEADSNLDAAKSPVFPENIRPLEYRAALERLQKNVKAVLKRFDALRNRREADSNQKLAYVYELLVHKTSLDSDRHRQRSKNFFYGMLVAQAAMAISSLAIAARQRNLLWTLAFLAGLAAVCFSGYVYISM